MSEQGSPMIKRGQIGVMDVYSCNLSFGFIIFPSQNNGPLALSPSHQEAYIIFQLLLKLFNFHYGKFKHTHQRKNKITAYLKTAILPFVTIPP